MEACIKDDFMNIIQYENYQEKPHNVDSAFPYLTYLCSIPLDFTKVPLHWHEEMEFVYIKKGTGIVSVDFIPYQVCAGDIVTVCPGQLHSLEQLGGYSMEYENIIFSFRLLGSRQSDICREQYFDPIACRQITLPALLTPHTDGYAEISACLDTIDQIRQSFPDGYELFIKGKLFELFYYLYVHPARVRLSGSASVDASASAAQAARQQKAMDKIRQILKYMEQHYPEKLSIKEMAEACGFSQSHFMKFFKTTIGMPFTVFLNDYRLTMASRLLLSSEDTILTVAADTGFENLSYFNRMFKQKFGITPREFRQRGRI